MGGVTAALIAGSIIAGGSAYQAHEQRRAAKGEAESIKKANEKAITEAKALQGKSEDQARARIISAAKEQERSKSIFSTLGGSVGGGTIAKRLLGQ